MDGHRPRLQPADDGAELGVGEEFFRAGIFPNNSGTRSWSDVGHYTQIIWPGTTHVGCGISSNRGNDFLVCRYSPPGNVMGQRVP